MTERYRRRNFGNLDLDVTLLDPAAYARPWTVAVRAELTTDTEMLEWVCNEKGGGLEHWVGKASDEKRSAVKVSAAILATYLLRPKRPAATPIAMPSPTPGFSAGGTSAPQVLSMSRVGSSKRLSSRTQGKPQLHSSKSTIISSSSCIHEVRTISPSD